MEFVERRLFLFDSVHPVDLPKRFSVLLCTQRTSHSDAREYVSCFRLHTNSRCSHRSTHTHTHTRLRLVLHKSRKPDWFFGDAARQTNFHRRTVVPCPYASYSLSSSSSMSFGQRRTARTKKKSKRVLRRATRINTHSDVEPNRNPRHWRPQHTLCMRFIYARCATSSDIYIRVQ